MKPRRHIAFLVLAFASSLAACAAVQVRENTLEMVNDVARIREAQVLRNIGAAISDHDMVPSEILLGAGQATVATAVSPSLKLPHFDFSRPTKELDVSATDTWTAQWQVAPVTNSDDLRRLRDLYVLIASTDDQYDELEAYFRRHPEQRAGPECYGGQPPASLGSAAERFLRSDLPSEPPAASGPVRPGVCPPGYGAGQIPKWRKAVDVIENGDSIGCKLFQEADPGKAAVSARKGLPFRRWLFWRRGGGAWGPNPPESEPVPLGQFGAWELGVTSRACLNDFVILVQSATPAAESSSAGGPKLMLNTQ
ncbi:MAG: hypothetical protein ACHP7N_10155 [Caulobacterales bacterium]